MSSFRNAWLTLGLAGCGSVPPPGVHVESLRATSDVVYYHQTVGAGPSLVTRTNGTPLDERRYEPFGAGIDSSSGPVDYAVDPHNILNKESDVATGWSDHGARWMAPETARWLTPDPPVKKPDPKFMLEPWSLHPYQYASQNPVMFWDPDGRDHEILYDADTVKALTTSLAEQRRHAAAVVARRQEIVAKMGGANPAWTKPPEATVKATDIIEYLEFNPNLGEIEYSMGHLYAAPLIRWTWQDQCDDATNAFARQVLYSRHKEDTASDAYRHAWISYRMTEEFGFEMAKNFGDAHEVSNRNNISSLAMDLWNNQVGRWLALKYSGKDTDADTVIRQAYRDGLLMTRPQKVENDKTWAKKDLNPQP